MCYSHFKDVNRSQACYVLKLSRYVNLFLECLRFYMISYNLIFSVMMFWINLEHYFQMITTEISAFVSALSPEEHAKIRPVLERDLEFQRREKARIKFVFLILILNNFAFQISENYCSNRKIFFKQQRHGRQTELRIE